jgi:hypothetical protein
MHSCWEVPKAPGQPSADTQAVSGCVRAGWRRAQRAPRTMVRWQQAQALEQRLARTALRPTTALWMPPQVVSAVRKFVTRNKLQDVPMFALGVSSGGAFALTLPRYLQLAGVCWAWVLCWHRRGAHGANRACVATCVRLGCHPRQHRIAPRNTCTHTHTHTHAHTHTHTQTNTQACAARSWPCRGRGTGGSCSLATTQRLTAPAQARAAPTPRSRRCSLCTCRATRTRPRAWTRTCSCATSS